MCFCGARGRGRIRAQGWEGWKRGHARTGTAPTGDPLVLSCSTSRHSAVPAHRPPALLPYSVAPSDHMPSQATCPAGSSCLRCLLLGAGAGPGASHPILSCSFATTWGLPSEPCGGRRGLASFSVRCSQGCARQSPVCSSPSGVGWASGGRFPDVQVFSGICPGLTGGPGEGFEGRNSFYSVRTCP